MGDKPAIDVHVLMRMDELAAAADLFRTIWGTAEEPTPIAPEVLRAISYAGGYVGGAFANGRLTGASAGFLGDGARGRHLHSHIAGVARDQRDRSVGLALKLHQRQWARERGIPAIEWTYDALVRRNAYFNLVKLGARAVTFETRFYGAMADAVNAGDESDRVVVRWEVDSDRVEPPEATATVLHPDDAGQPVTSDSSADVVRAWVPNDIVAMRRDDPVSARAWRLAFRAAVGARLAADHVGVSMSRDGWYTLTRSAR